MTESDQPDPNNVINFRDRLENKQAGIQAGERERQHEAYPSLLEASAWLLETVDHDDPDDVQTELGELYAYAVRFDIPYDVFYRAWEDALAEIEGSSGQS